MEPHKEYSSIRPRPELPILTAVIVFCSILFTVLISGCSSNFSLNGSPLENKQAHAYVDEVVPIITTNWKEKDLVERAHPALKKELTGDKLEKMFKMFSTKLGPIKKYKSAKQVAFRTNFDANGQHNTADYVVDVDFAKGPGQIKMTVVEENNKLSILSFFVNSDALMGWVKQQHESNNIASIAAGTIAQ